MKDKIHDAEVFDEDDIFQEAARQMIEKNPEYSIELVQNKVSVSKAKKKESINFKKLEKKVDNEYAQRFNDIMETLPDREFMRNYLKVIEYFKPKVTRGTGDDGPKVNQTINVVIKR